MEGATLYGKITTHRGGVNLKVKHMHNMETLTNLELTLYHSRGAKIERAHAKWRGPTLNIIVEALKLKGPTLKWRKGATKQKVGR